MFFLTFLTDRQTDGQTDLSYMTCFDTFLTCFDTFLTVFDIFDIFLTDRQTDIQNLDVEAPARSLKNKSLKQIFQFQQKIF